MWNSSGDGYGGQNEGGFMAGDSQFDSPTTKEQTRGRKVQNLVPMSLRSIQECGENRLQVADLEVHMAVVVGLIRAVDVTSTKVTYTLDDTTTVMDVVQWIESDNGPEDDGRSSLMEMTYCRAAGTMRTQQGKRHLMAFQITPVTDLNVITNHLLLVMHSVLKIQQIQTMEKADAGGVGGSVSSMPNSLVGAGIGEGVGLGGGGGGGFSGGMQGLNGPQKLVYQAIHQCPHEAGVARSAIYSTLTGKIQHKQIDDVLEFLSSEGHIYSTIDDDHFKSTDG